MDIAKFVVEILKHPDLAETMGKNGRKRVTEQFTWDTASENTLKGVPGTCGYLKIQ